MLFNTYYHPCNKKTSLEEIRKMTLTQLLDFRESLEAISLLEEAAQKDAQPPSTFSRNTG